MKVKAALLSVLVLCSLAMLSFAQKAEKGFTAITDGKSFNGWKMAEENKDAWTLKDGAIVAHGSRSHLYYVGDSKPFVNFELKVDVMTEPGSNGGIYFHTQYQEKDWPKAGYEVQVNQTHTDWRKTGSLYAISDVKEQLVKDGEWYTYHIIVKGKHITIKINDKVSVEYDEPADKKPGPEPARVLDKGVFALQAHDPKSTVYYKNIRVKRLS
jgi:hypothetical protein